MKWREFVAAFPDANYIKKGHYERQGVTHLYQTLIKDATNWYIVYNSRLHNAEQPLQEREKTVSAIAFRVASTGVKRAARIDLDAEIPSLWVNPHFSFVEPRYAQNYRQLDDYRFVIKTLVNPSNYVATCFRDEAGFYQTAFEFGEYVEVRRSWGGITRKIIIPYVEGENLADFIDDRILIPKSNRERCCLLDALNIAVKILQDLIRLHSLGIWHLDIKPLNIKVGEDITRIIDFGVSVRHNGDNEIVVPRNFCGDLGYAPPEFFKQAVDRKRQLVVSDTADVFSVGMVLCDLLVTVDNTGGRAEFLEKGSIGSKLDKIPDYSPCKITMPDMNNKFQDLWQGDPYFEQLSATGEIDPFLTRLKNLLDSCTGDDPAARCNAAYAFQEMQELRDMVRPLVDSDNDSLRCT